MIDNKDLYSNPHRIHKLLIERFPQFSSLRVERIHYQGVTAKSIDKGFGVYFILDLVTEEIKYIGTSGNVKYRVMQHLDIKGCPIGTNHYFYLINNIPYSQVAFDIEAYFINHFRPPLNRLIRKDVAGWGDEPVIYEDAKTSL